MEKMNETHTTSVCTQSNCFRKWHFFVYVDVAAAATVSQCTA